MNDDNRPVGSEESTTTDGRSPRTDSDAREGDVDAMAVSEHDDTSPDTAVESASTESEATSSDRSFVERHKPTVRGLLLTLAIASAIVLAAVVVPALLADSAPDEPAFESFDPDRTVTEPFSADGTIEPADDVSSDSGTVVIEGAGGQRGTVMPLVEAFDRTDHDVEFSNVDLAEDLDGANALVIVDPRTSFGESKLDTIEEFADEGGRVVIFGQPNRFEINGGPFGPGITEVESQLTDLGARFDLHFDTRYVYDQQQNAGNFRHVLVETHPDAELTGGDGSLDDAQDIVLYTPTEVRSTGDGEPVLVTGSSAQTSDSDVQREHTVAIRDGNVLAVGDAAFIGDDRYAVADNNAFLAAIVEFLVAGDAVDIDDDDDDENDDDDDEEDDDGGSDEDEPPEGE